MISRRNLVKFLGVSAVGITALPRKGAAAEAPQVAITMDDFNLFGAAPAQAQKRNQAILSALRAHSNLKAAIFVAGKHVDSALGRQLLQQWNDAGHIIANHTYSHQNYATSSFADYAQDVLRCERLLAGYPQFRRLFRFPMLKEGDTAEHRDRMRQFLSERGYRIGAVTIDNSDWYIDRRLRGRLAKNPAADTAAYRNYYLEHIRDCSAHYDDLARRALGRSVKHTLLVHHNVLNERYLSDILQQYKRSGWKLIDAQEAFADPLYQERPSTLPGGDSLVLALARQAGVVGESRYPAEGAEHEAPRMDRLGL